MKQSKKPKKIMLEGLQYEIAQDIGLDEKVRQLGWGSLTSAEAGRIGGILSGRSKKKRKESQP